MADRTLDAFASIADIEDGVAGVSIVFSNENHTFIADTAGVVSDTDLAAFSSGIDVYVGTGIQEYTPGAAALAAGQWRISDGVNEGAAAITGATGLAVALADGGDSAVLTVANAAGPGGFADGGAGSPDSVNIVVPIQVRLSASTLMFSRVISLSKARGGSARYLTLTASDQVLPFDADGDLVGPTDQIVFDAALHNFTTADNVEWHYRTSPTSAWTALAAGAGVVFSQTQNRRLSVTRQALNALLGNADRAVAIRAQLSGQLDIVSVAKIQDGAPGTSVIELRLLPRSSNLLRNNQGSVIFDARLFYRGGVADDAISAYQWFTVAAGAKTNIAGATAAFREFVALAAGGGTRLIGCRVTYDDAHADVTG